MIIVNKVAFFTGLKDGQHTCIAYLKEEEPVLNGRGGFGKPMRLIFMGDIAKKFSTEFVLVSWLEKYYPHEVDRQFVIAYEPKLISYLRKHNIEYE